ncbi:hypothetical protein [Cognatiluteimonas lumbrici]|uniref:hypothetical protein n=1 Tax=Cognatiluteimonas lumbrici TaxID=2559601 RepID=UPI00112D4832|nr:hypothetical protein [Luteimonas lumbrici]
MKTLHRHRLLAALALGALLATGFSVSAEPAAARDKDRKEHRKDRKEQRQERREGRREARQDRREDRREAKQERREDRREARQDNRQVRARIAQRQASQRAHQQRIRSQQQARAQHQARQRAYQQRLRAEQARQAAQRRAYYYSRHYSPGTSYRYNYGGRWYSTSHYGADVLRAAVQRGYQEGLRAGRSDRYDRWGYDHRRSRIWIDGSHGFGGRYVSRADYAHYFRQGFQRGYEDGFYGRGRYGSYVNGEAIIIQAVLEAILGLQRLG